MMFFINILQAALVSAFVLTEPELAAPEPDDEATEPGDEAIERSSAPWCGPYGLACSMSGNTGTGRQWGCVTPSANDSSVCIRRAQGGTAPRGSKSCHSTAYEDLGCSQVFTD